jgi:glycosyltransferase involved in cell wall biosynthesis
VGHPRVLIVHNRYQQRGGEDEVFAAEQHLLQSRNHVVEQYVAHNDSITDGGRLRLTKNTIWNSTVYTDVRRILIRHRPDVVHFHNTFPLVSPAAYYAARAEGVPVVQTLHNYRLVCPNAILFRDGQVCEDCIGRTIPWPGVVHGCYRGSRLASAATAAMLSMHRLAGTWREAVDVYIALTNFARGKFVAGGIPASRITVKPNFLNHDPGVGDHLGGYALFVGRLTREKGVQTLLHAWAQLEGRVPLKIVGTGPLGALAEPQRHGIEWLGAQPHEQVLELMKHASFLVFPSEWYEGFPMTLVEAFATGLPVIAAARGSAAELIDDEETGYLFEPGNASALAARVEQALTYPDARARLGRQARAVFESKYTATTNYSQLITIYESVCGRA